MKRYSPTFLLLLMIIATLLPPYNWGDERLKTKEERNRNIHSIGKLDDLLPVKKYDLIFNNSKQEIFVGWGFNHDENKSTRAYLILERHLITEELVLNYILCVLIASGFFFFEKKIEPFFKNKRFLIALVILIIVVIGSVVFYSVLTNSLYKKEIVTVPENGESRFIKRPFIKRGFLH